ncbi:MAG: hypothetical protein VX700_13985 [Pseudomonadota bacterium]|nr:hypothetical protein [Pseudomonadota bacterium]
MIGEKTTWRKLRGFSVAALVTPVLILLTPFFSFLKFQEYPILTAEVGFLFAIIILLGLVLGGVIRFGGRTGAAIVVATTIIIFLDVQFEVRLSYLAAGGAVLLIASYFVSRAILPVIAVVAGVVLISTVLLPAQLKKPEIATASDKNIRKELPAIIHIVLDEHIGIEGIEARTELERKARANLKSLYKRNGFKLFGGAYSNYAETFNSLPNLLNSTLSETSYKFIGQGRDRLPALKHNAYFEGLAERGYKIRVYQSKYFNYCDDQNLPILSCESYNYTGLDNLDALTNDPTVKSRLILARFVNRSRIYGLARSIYQHIAVGGFFALKRIENNNFAPLASYPFFEVLEKDLARDINGQVYFAHLLIPHRPFMFDAKCGLVLDHPYDDMERNSSSWITEYTKAYYEQVACTAHRLQGLFDALNKSEDGKKATVIVHGDHGSRIGPRDAKLENWPYFDAEQFRAYYSTLFAVRAPGIEAGYSDTLFSIGRLFDAVKRHKGETLDLVQDNPHFVIVPSKDGLRMEKKPVIDFRLGKPLVPSKSMRAK